MNCFTHYLLVIIIPIMASGESEERESISDRSSSNEGHADQSIDNEINDNEINDNENEISWQDDNDIAWQEESKKNLDNVKAPWNQDIPIPTKDLEDENTDQMVNLPFKTTVETEELTTAMPIISGVSKPTTKHVYSIERNNSASISEEEPICQQQKLQPKVVRPSYPYTAAILKKGVFYATGALLENGWILTAASEFYNTRESIRLFSVRLGSTDAKYGGVTLPLRSAHIHPSFVQGRPHYDLALLKIATGVNYTKEVQASELSRVTAGVDSAKFLVTYWPRLIIKGQLRPSSAKERLRPHSMRVSLQRLVPWEECYSNLSSRLLIDTSILCLNPIAAHHTVCSPDPGAPVAARDGLWGVTSGWTAEDCATSPSPTLMTRVSTPAVTQWIEKIVGNGTRTDEARGVKV